MKTILKNYSFSTSGKTITCTDVSTVRLDRLLLITDVTTNKILYNFADSTVSTATVATNVITLSTLQGGEANSDKLDITYDTLTGDGAFGDSTDAVSVLASVLPTGAATSANQINGNQIVQALGSTAAGATLTNPPVVTGGLAKTALPTAVSDGQVVNSMLDKFGRNITIPQAPRDLMGMQSTTITASTGANTVVSAIASTFTDISSIVFTNISSTATEVTLSDGTNTYTYYVPGNDMRGAVYQVPLPATTANTVWQATTITSVTSVIVTVQYIKNK